VIYGYARVSTGAQDLASRLAELKSKAEHMFAARAMRFVVSGLFKIFV
jgi:DNA invertase Pin-like site-specific DNA recombinase